MDLIPKEEKSFVNKKAIFIGVGILVVAVVVFFAFRSKTPSGGEAVTPGGTPGTTTSTVDKYAPEKVSADTRIPGEGENLGGGVAAPTVVTGAAPGVEAKLRSFNISVTGNQFVPDTVVVRIGDTVNMFITAQDKDYDFFLPNYELSTTLPKGQRKTVLFQALAEGKYEFFCKSCGGPDKGPVGYVTIVPKQ